MNNNTHTNRVAFELGQVRAADITSVEQFDSEASPVGIDQDNIRAYTAGVLAGLNQRLGRLQYAYDLDLEAGNDVHAEGVELEAEKTYKLIREFTFEYAL